MSEFAQTLARMSVLGRENNLTLEQTAGFIAGFANATGVADELKLFISGVGSFDGSNLFSKNADTHISGAGNATVHPKGELTAEISGTGFVRFYGTPHVTSRISGLGSVNKISE